jgi:hypothetical protein
MLRRDQRRRRADRGRRIGRGQTSSSAHPAHGGEARGEGQYVDDPLHANLQRQDGGWVGWAGWVWVVGGGVASTIFPSTRSLYSNVYGFPSTFGKYLPPP